MKKYAIGAMIFLLSACSKELDMPVSPTEKNEVGKVSAKDLEKCFVAIDFFNTTKRSSIAGVRKGKPATSTEVKPSTNVILLDFDGHVVSNTSWNTTGDIACAPANLTETEMTKVIDRVTEDYRPFDVTVTTDEAIYNAANPYRRMRVIITETWEWFGRSGGTSFTGSFTWGDNTPCFVFSVLLNYSEKKIGEAASHEAGHTLGLRHQSSYDNCTKISEYNSGTGTGETSWAPIMGSSYDRNVTTWHNGPNPYGCTVMQNDLSIITNLLPYKGDDYGNGFTNVALLASSADGIINTEDDVDVFSISLSGLGSVSAVPFSIGAAAGANVDLKLSVYDRNGNLLKTISDPGSLSAAVLLSAGRYYIAVETEANEFSTRYGMLGKYTISIK